MQLVNISHPLTGFPNENTDLGGRADPPPLSIPPSGTSVTIDAACQLEALASQRADPRLQLESTSSATAVTSDGRNPFEFLASQAAGRYAMLENTSLQRIDPKLYNDFLASVQKDSGPGIPRVAAANNCNLPYTYFTDTSWVHNSWTTHTAGPAGYTQVRVTFANWIISVDSEVAGFYDFTLRAGLLYNGTFYPFLFSGQRDVVLSKTFGHVTSDALTVSIPAGASFTVTNRRVATDLGAAGSYNVLTSTGGGAWQQSGIIAGTDISKDYTLGVGIAYGATINQGSVTVTAGAVNNSMTIANGGQNYTTGANVVPYYGPGGAGAPGALHPGTGFGAYTNASGGVTVNVSVYAGGAAHNAGNLPPFIIVGSNIAASGMGTPSACYGPSLITGLPGAAVPSVLGLGDSTMAGYGSSDLYGDIAANFGAYEQALANRYGIFKMAVGGEQAAGWLTNNTHMLAYIADLLNRGYLTITHTVIVLGINDFLTNVGISAATVTSAINSIGAVARGWGSKVICTTILPANTGTFTTTGGQTPYNSNYNLGGSVDTYNASILGGTGPTNDGYIDIRTRCQDATVTTAWRVDAFGAGNAFTTDGIHPSNTVGIPYLVLNMSISTFTVSPVSSGTELETIMTANTRDAAVRLESLASQAVNPLVQLESTGAVAVSTDGDLQLEFLAGQKSDARAPLETYGLLLIDARLPLEDTALQAAGEHLQAETLTLAVMDPRLGNEILTTQTVDPKLQLENTGAVLITIDGGLPFEFIAQIRRDAAAPLETAGLLVADSRLLAEVVSAVLADRHGPLENLTLGQVRRLTPLESAALTQRDATCPLENVTLSTGVTADGALRFEVLAGQKRDATAPMDLNAALRGDGHLCLEWRATAPPPPGARILSARLEGRVIIPNPNRRIL